MLNEIFFHQLNFPIRHSIILKFLACSARCTFSRNLLTVETKLKAERVNSWWQIFISLNLNLIFPAALFREIERDNSPFFS